MTRSLGRERTKEEKARTTDSRNPRQPATMEAT